MVRTSSATHPMTWCHIKDALCLNRDHADGCRCYTMGLPCIYCTARTVGVHSFKSGVEGLMSCRHQWTHTTNITTRSLTTRSSGPSKARFRTRSHLRRPCCELYRTGTGPLCLISKVAKGCWWCAMAPVCGGSWSIWTVSWLCTVIGACSDVAIPGHGVGYGLGNSNYSAVRHGTMHTSGKVPPTYWEACWR